MIRNRAGSKPASAIAILVAASLGLAACSSRDSRASEDRFAAEAAAARAEQAADRAEKAAARLAKQSSTTTMEVDDPQPDHEFAHDDLTPPSFDN